MWISAHVEDDFVTYIKNYDLAVGGEKSMRIPRSCGLFK